MTKARGVIFATYNGLLDPLGPSQILPYLERLNVDWPIHILSFERPHRLEDGRAVAEMEHRLDHHRIRWTRLRYHKWPSLPATAFDLVHGIARLRWILATEKIGLIHARSYVTMTLALRATRRIPVLFDIRGLQADEYVDGGVWRKGELKWRLAKRSERSFFRRAAGAVVLTDNIRPEVMARFAAHGRQPPLEVIPCCVDLGRFRFDAEERQQARRALGVDEDATVLVYSGSLGTWYLADEMARFARTFERETSRRTVLLWLVNNEPALAWAASRRAGLADAQVRVVAAGSHEMPAYLSAADAGLALIKPSPSKRSSSPTKYAEYLATGLPVLLSRHVGDGARIVDAGGGVGLERFDDQEYQEAARSLDRLLRRSRQDYRQIAERMFDVDRVALPAYHRLYESLVLR